MAAPTIVVPTPDQYYVFGDKGHLLPPTVDLGTGSTPTWSITADDFSVQPGVQTLTIDPVTGVIIYEIKRISADPDEQALNTKGPYTIVRRITTSEGFDEEVFKNMVNVGDTSLAVQAAIAVWFTRTARAVGVQEGYAPSEAVTQKYTVI